jgi:hypothetical protein
MSNTNKRFANALNLSVRDSDKLLVFLQSQKPNLVTMLGTSPISLMTTKEMGYEAIETFVISYKSDLSTLLVLLEQNVKKGGNLV